MKPEIKTQIQEIIDLMAQNDFFVANEKLITVNELLDELLDFAEDDEKVIELSQYQILLNHLQVKITEKRL